MEGPSTGAETDVLIVGGGIGGAALALAMGRRGWRVRILERHEAPAGISRPEILHESTVAALERLGVGPRLRAEAVLSLRGIEVLHDGAVVVDVDQADLTAAQVSPFSTDPALTRRLIMDDALATGMVELVRGAEVMDVTREGARVVGVRARKGGVTFESRGRLIVGDDGVRSVIRGGLGIKVKLRLFPLEFVAFGLQRPEAAPADVAKAWLDPAALSGGIVGGLFVPLPGDRMAGILLMPIETWEQQFKGEGAHFWQSLAELTPMAGALQDRLSFPDDFMLLRRPYGHAASYVADGAALLGDAAHPMSPAGGQGANAAIWDAIALADVADEALRNGDLSAARLSSYEKRRRPANARSLRFTHRAVALARLGRWLPGGDWLLTSLLRQAGRDDARKRLFLRQVATAFLDAGPRG